MKENKSKKISFFTFITSQAVRRHLITSLIGMIIMLVGIFIVKSNKISLVVNFIGAVMVFTASEEIIKNIPKNR